MIVFENKKFSKEGKMNIGVGGNPLETYVDVLLDAALSPPSGGFSPKELYDLYKLIDKVSKDREKEIINIEDTDFEKLKDAFGRMRTIASREVAELYEYMQSI